MTAGEKKPSGGGSRGFVYLLSGMAVIGGFLFGYDTGVVSGAILYVQSDQHLDYLWTQLVVSVTLGACAISSAAASWLNDRFGRKPVILSTSALFTLGSLVLAAAEGKEMLLSGRVVVGLAVGASSATIPPYLAEASPRAIRGFLVTSFQLMVTFGFFSASVLAGAFSYVDPLHTGWRLMFGCAAIPAFIQLVGFYFLPESPRWLATKGREADAHAVLARINDSDKVADAELADIRASAAAEKLKDAGDGWVLRRMWASPPVRRALLVGCSLQTLQQLSGVNTLMFYTASVVRMSGIRDSHEAIWMTCAITGVNFLFTFLPFLLIDRMGRRKLLLGSLVGVFLSLILLGVGFVLINGDCPRTSVLPVDNGTLAGLSGGDLSAWDSCSVMRNSDNCVTQERCGLCYPVGNASRGFCLPTGLGVSATSLLGPCRNASAIDAADGTFVWAWNFCPTRYTALPVLGMVAFLSTFSTGLAPIPWVVNSEIYPNWARSTGVSAATTCNWVANLLISQTFLYLTEALTKAGAFFLYAAVTVVAFCLFYKVVPETKGVAVEDMEELFGGPKRLQPKEADDAALGKTKI